MKRKRKIEVTEEPKILIEIRWSEKCPVREILQRSAVHRALIDVPSDVSPGGTIARTKGEESHLSGGIDQLEFRIRNAETGDHTTKTGQHEMTISDRECSILPDGDHLRKCLFHSDEKIPDAL